MRLVRVDAVADVDRADALLELVDRIQAGPPYSYAPGEIPPASAWFTDLVARAELTVVALDDTENPVGYGVALSWQAYGKLDGYAEPLGLDPDTTMYLAELGVAPNVRRRGLAGAILTEMHRALPPSCSACAVRTLADNEPAIALYRGHGYRLVDHVEQLWRGRARIFLVHRSPDRTA